MKNINKYIENLIGNKELEKLTSEEIIGEISLNLYNKENYEIREKEIFDSLPIIIRDIILLIDFDTELSMEGILGFLENSTGLFLDETTDMLKRINAVEDYEILTTIKEIMLRYEVSIQELRNNANAASEYEIRNFSRTHEQVYDEMAEEVGQEAEKLYLYSDDRNIFDNLEKYVGLNREFI